ncbi:hypothetical protein PT276_02200 [Orbaceae bacterium ESL0721]|nr:hypothetical protein [Orbaceae bacterium ESL0721]
MKSLTIKKVALGVFLAGYAASGAFALTATTNNSIQGNAPGLASPGADPISGKVTNSIRSTIVKSTIDGQVSRIGDQVRFEFVTVDKDGDTPAANPKKGSAGSEGTFSVLYRKNGTWVEADPTSYTYEANGKILFTLGKDAGGADKIGYKIAAKTQYGDPNIGNWIFGPTLGADTANIGGSEPDANNGSAANENKDKDLGGTGGTGDKDSNANGPFNPIPSDGVSGAIFRVNAAGLTADNNYSSNTANPKLGETFKLVVWDDANTNYAVDSGETTFVPTNIQWTAAGGNAAANGASAADVDLVGQTTDTIVLPALNSDVATWFGGKTPEAGIQGFKLKVSYQ